MVGSFFGSILRYKLRQSGRWRLVFFRVTGIGENSFFQRIDISVQTERFIAIRITTSSARKNVKQRTT